MFTVRVVECPDYYEMLDCIDDEHQRVLFRRGDHEVDRVDRLP